jgi:HEAT repeat protein
MRIMMKRKRKYLPAVRDIIAIVLFVFFICLLSFEAYGNETSKMHEDLHSVDVNIRVRAATALAQSHDIEGVKEALKDNDKRVRHAAIYNLSILPVKGRERRDPQAVAVFIEGLKDKDPGVRYAALYNLRDFEIEASFSSLDMDPDICSKITPLLSDPAENIRYLAVMNVEKCRIKETEDELLKLAADKKEPLNIRQTAIMKLSKSRTKDIDTIIMNFLESDEDQKIKVASVHSLGNLKSAKAVDAIIPYVYSNKQAMQNTAIISLGEIGDPRAAAALSDVLINSNGKIADFVLNSLSKAGSPAALPKLFKIKPLLKDVSSKAKYIEALGATGSDEAVAHILEFFDEKDESLQFQTSRALDRFDSPSALREIIEFSKKRPDNKQLSYFALKAQRKIDSPVEALIEKQKQKEDAFVLQREGEINRIYYEGMRLIKNKKYETALPKLYEAIDKFEKLYTSYPAHFKSSSNLTIQIRNTLAGYYRWKKKDLQKSVSEYDKLISTLERFDPDSGAMTAYLLMLGEIYENDLKDYEKAVFCYEAALKPFKDQDKMKNEKQYLAGWYISWIGFLPERINVLKLKRQSAFTKRTFKYPNLEYSVFASFGSFSAAPEWPFDENYPDYSEETLSPDLFDRLYKRDPGSSKTMFSGLALFHQFLKDNMEDKAVAVADKFLKYYPDDLHTIMLILETAELCKKQKNEKKYSEYLEKGLKTAKSLNVELVIGPDPRFASPEKTWALFVKSLKEGNIDASAECFSPDSRDRYIETFKLLKDKLPELALGMKEIRKVKTEDDSAEYYIKRTENGQEISYGIRFVNIFDEWKIDQF